MDVDYGRVAYAGAGLLQLIDDGAKRQEYDRLLVQAGVLIEAELRTLLAELIDEINSAVGSHYRVRLVHEDTRDFVEVIPSAEATAAEGNAV